MPSISVHEGDSYDPNGPLADLDKKVTVTTDAANEDMSDEERADTFRGVDPDVLRDAREDYADGDGPQHVDLRTDQDEDEESPTPASGEEKPSAGNSSPTSGDSTGKSSSTNEPASPATAPSTGGRSIKGRTASSTASSEGTSSGK